MGGPSILRSLVSKQTSLPLSKRPTPPQVICMAGCRRQRGECVQAVAAADALWKLKGLRALGRVDRGTVGSMRALLPSTALLVLRSAAISGTLSFATAAATRRAFR